MLSDGFFFFFMHFSIQSCIQHPLTPSSNNSTFQQHYLPTQTMPDDVSKEAFVCTPQSLPQPTHPRTRASTKIGTFVHFETDKHRTLHRVRDRRLRSRQRSLGREPKRRQPQRLDVGGRFEPRLVGHSSPGRRFSGGGMGSKGGGMRGVGGVVLHGNICS